MKKQIAKSFEALVEAAKVADYRPEDWFIPVEIARDIVRLDKELTELSGVIERVNPHPNRRAEVIAEINRRASAGEISAEDAAWRVQQIKSGEGRKAALPLEQRRLGVGRLADRLVTALLIEQQPGLDRAADPVRAVDERLSELLGKPVSCGLGEALRQRREAIDCELRVLGSYSADVLTGSRSGRKPPKRVILGLRDGEEIWERIVEMAGAAVDLDYELRDDEESFEQIAEEEAIAKSLL